MQQAILTAMAMTLLISCGRDVSTLPEALHPYGAVDAARLARAAEQPGEWLMPGGDGSGAYYSRLAMINSHNVAQLGFAWDYKLGTNRGLEATPIVVDGTMYTSGNWGHVYALDAATGRLRWTYDPAVDAQSGRHACCDVVNRGVVVWEGKVYVASLDGYLHAIDAATGQRIWRVDTLPGRGSDDRHYTITGAPLIAGNLIVIGNGGAEFTHVRGSVSAYDLKSGEFRWRFYTVPRDPKLGDQDQPHLEAAVKTWPANYDWSVGGGATVWDGMSYDPELHLIFLGTANPSPYVIGKDAPSGDELYADSVLAVRAETGALAWYFQEVPGDGWDYDATQKMVLTDLQLNGHSRKVLLQAAKNGFFYIFERSTGELLSARPFTFINWTKGLDPKTHRPIRNAQADYSQNPRLVFPSMYGAHSWQPMSFNATTGLVYLPAMDAAMVYIETAKRPAGTIEGFFTVAGIFPEDYEPKALANLYGSLPRPSEVAPSSAHDLRSRGVLRAFDPTTGRVMWEQPGRSIWDGGVLSTSGNLVIRGDVAGYLNVYAADTGKVLKEVDVGTSIMAAPTTYAVAGEQYVAVMAGYGGGMLGVALPEDSAALRYGNAGRIVTFKLGGGSVPKPDLVVYPPFPAPPPHEGSAQKIAAGGVLYNRFCSRCHVLGHGLLPDLRRLSKQTHQIFYDIVLDGAYRGKGMARWDDVLSRADAEAIHAYLVDQSWQAFEHPRVAGGAH